VSEEQRGASAAPGRQRAGLKTWSVTHFVAHQQTWVSWGLAAGCSFVTEGWGAPACAAGAGAVPGWIVYRYGTERRHRHIGWRGARDGFLSYGAGRTAHYVRRGRALWRSARLWRGGLYSHVWPHL
jgi:hypothetical protein